MWLIFYCELIVLMRRSSEWLYPLSFFLIVILLIPLAFSPAPQFLERYAAGGIWLAALLASLLSIETFFLSDKEDGYLEQLLLSQFPLSLLISVKLLAQWFVTQLILILCIPFLGIVFHFSFYKTLILCISLLLGTPILTCIGSLGVALTLGLRQQGMLLGLLIFPLVIPVLIFGLSLVQQADANLPILAPFSFLAGLNILSMTLLPFAIAYALRLSVDE